MRFYVCLFALVCLAGTAFARPKVAVAPFRGSDVNDKVSKAIAEALGEQSEVTDPADTWRAISKLGFKTELDNDKAKKVQKKLGVAALVQGRLDKVGAQKTLKITVFVRGKQPSKFTVQFKTLSDKFKEDVRDQILKKVSDADEDEDEVAARKKKKEDDDKRADDDRRADDDKKKTKKKDDDQATDDNKKTKKTEESDPDDRKKKKKKKEVAEGDEEPTKIKKRKKHRETEESPMPRRVAARADVGVSGGIRRLTYTATMSPIPVGTRAVAARVEGEIYPFALGETQQGPAAGLGLAGEFEKTLGLSITPPGGTAAIPISQGHYSVGGRYRINANATTMLVLGLDYGSRHYSADRSAGAIDFPDVAYKSVSPNICVMKLVTPTIGLFARLGGSLILDTGPIQERTQYGAARVYGIDARLGADFALSQRLALRLAGDFGQISFKFKGNGDAAVARGVTAAIDRQFGLSTTLAVTY